MTRLHGPWWLFAAAACFAGCAAIGLGIWIRGPEPPFLYYRFDRQSMIVEKVRPGSSAQRAGIQVGDRIVSFDGRPTRGTADWDLLSISLEAGHPYTVEIDRLDRRERLALVLEPRSVSRWSAVDRLIAIVDKVDGFLCLLLAAVLAFGKPLDRTARLGALILALLGISLIVPFAGTGPAFRALPPLLGVLAWWPNMGFFLFPTLFFIFSATFPRPLFRARWAWAFALAPTALFLLLGIPGFFVATFFDVRSVAVLHIDPEIVPRIGATILTAYVAAALVALIMNYRRLSLSDRRRVRVLVVGTVLGPAAITAGDLIALAVGLQTAVRSGTLDGIRLVRTFLLPLLPMSWCYAILRHRVFDIRVIVRQGIQYALARRVLVTAVPVLGLLLLADVLLHATAPLADTLRARGWVYIAVGAIAVVTNLNRERWLAALDRRFFRERYDAQRLLLDVVEQVRQARSFGQLAPQVVRQVEAALHARFVALLTRESNDASYRCVAVAPDGHTLPVIAANARFIGVMRLLGKPLDVQPEGSTWLSEQLPSEEARALREANIELIVPIVTGGGTSASPSAIEAILVLGPKRSEEPYARADRDLLVTIATSLAIVLEQAGAVVPVGDAFAECPECGACYDAGAAQCPTDGRGLATVHLPRRLDARYLLHRRLGRGGMGAVYAASDSALERRVAVKVVREELVADETAADRFRREARSAASFAHPNVVTIHDFGVTGARAFLVMELLDGETLRDALAGHPRFDARRALAVLSGVCAAVGAAHRRRLVHRDLKPENIFLARGDSGETVKVLDFGLAKFTSAVTDQATGRTAPGAIAGTPRYMAPEQWLGEAVDSSWDTWALGVIAYELIAGAHPFGDAPASELSRRVLAGRFTPIAAHVNGAPASLQAFFERALSTDPSRRPRSADLFHAELADLLTGS